MKKSGTAGPVASRRILTLPNVVTAARLALVPLFAWLFLGRSNDAFALAVLFVIGSTDWVDGFLARRLGQVSKLGEVLDPIADRVAVIVLLVVLLLRQILPVPLAAAILVRDLLVAVGFAALQAKKIERIEVNLVGKAATAAIYAGIGMIVAALVMPSPEVWRTTGLVMLTAGAGAYWVAGVMYALRARRLLEGDEAGVVD
jgi:cardiolipin synthase